jgi:hypothetical protein
LAVEKSILAKFTCEKKAQICSFHVMNGYLYIGTGPDGIVYRTSSGFDLTEFYKTGESYVTAISDYGNALFCGTSSGGKIMMHNFTTGNRFNYVNTGDYKVTSFCVYKDKLYAGTSPSGIILSFNGTSWGVEYDCYGGGVKDMRVLGDSMYVFVDQIEFVPCLTDGKWTFMKSGEDVFSITGFKKVKTTIDSLQKNLNFDFAFNAACVVGDKLYFSPVNSCNLYSFDGSNVSIVYQWDGEKIGAIESIGSSQIFVSVDNVIYVCDLE